MKEERGNINGDTVIAERYELWGKITGTVRVIDGAKFYMRGSVYGDMHIEDGGRMHIYGHHNGDLYIHRGAKVIHSGVITGNVTNDGGRLYIDRDGQVLGKVKTLKGETTVEPKDTFGDDDLNP